VRCSLRHEIAVSVAAPQRRQQAESRFTSKGLRGKSKCRTECELIWRGRTRKVNECAGDCHLDTLDSDVDGVSDLPDRCPETPAGEVAVLEGCSLSQLDADNDSVSDLPAVDVAGCALSQIDTVNDSVTRSESNHTQTLTKESKQERSVDNEDRCRCHEEVRRLERRGRERQGDVHVH